MMKMVMVVVPRDQAEDILRALVEAGFSATFTESRGGMLRQSQQMVFIVIDEDRVEDVLEIVHEGKEVRKHQAVGSNEIRKSGRVVFIWNIDRVETS